MPAVRVNFVLFRLTFFLAADFVVGAIAIHRHRKKISTVKELDFFISATPFVIFYENNYRLQGMNCQFVLKSPAVCAIL